MRSLLLALGALSVISAGCKSTQDQRTSRPLTQMFANENNIHLIAGSQLQGFKLQSGSFFSGYWWYTFDLESRKLSGLWHRVSLEGEATQASGEKQLNTTEADEINKLVQGLKVIEVQSEHACDSLPDGVKDSVELKMLDSALEEHTYSLVPEASYTAICGDGNVADEPYQKLLFKLGALLPAPDDPEAYQPIVK